MTTDSPMFTPNGDGYDITPPGVLLLLADQHHGGSDPHRVQHG